MSWLRKLLLAAPLLLLLHACGGDGEGATAPIVVNSVEDSATPATGQVTLRSALASAASGQAIHFAASLDGATIALTQVADAHTLLKGEVMGIRTEASGPVSYLVGYFDRDYGASALVARKDVVIDATALPSGITIAWAGGEAPGARVLAVEGDLTLRNVAITGGRSNFVAVPVQGQHPQPWTLARGGAVAVWGTARLQNCRLHGNSVSGDFDGSRDRGAFGGAVYADIVLMDGCLVAGNDVLGGGAAGGGVYAVGGAGSTRTLSVIERSSISGNRIRGLFAYGAGAYSDGGGIGNSKTLRVVNSTVARNLTAPPPGVPAPVLRAQGYWRGAGLYMSNGRMELLSSTVVENETQGLARTDSRGRRNLAGGIAATVGDAHAVEQMTVAHSIVAGNVVQEVGGARYAHDIFTGSLVYFRSGGYNRIGAIDFSQMLVPVGEWGWESLTRRHYPQAGDAEVASHGEVLDLDGGVATSPTVLSAGVVAGSPAVLHYAPRGSALDQVPAAAYDVQETWGQYRVASGGRDDFLAIVLSRLESVYGLTGLVQDFTESFEGFLRSVDADSTTDGVQPYTAPNGQPILSLADTQFFGPAETWPREQSNQPWVEFWHRLDTELAARGEAGTAPGLLNDAAWRGLFASSTLPENPSVQVSVVTRPRLRMERAPTDQRRVARPPEALADIGAIEQP